MTHLFLEEFRNEEIMDRGYEKFVGGPTPPRGTAIRVTIDRQNVITFNANCYRLMGKPPAVELYFNRQLDTIVLKSASVMVQTSFPVREKGPRESRVNAAPFCRHFGIKIDGTLRFIEPQFTPYGLELNLSKVVSVAKRRSGSKK
jgi:hypothetical protein